MLKTSSTESAEPRKGVVGVGGGGRNRAEPVGKHEVDGDEGGSCSGDSDKKCSSDAPKLMCPPAPLTSMLKTSSLTDSSTSTTQIVVEYNGVGDGGSCRGVFDRRFHPKLHGDFDVTFQVTRWRSRHCSSARTVAFDCASEADHQEPVPLPSIKALLS